VAPHMVPMGGPPGMGGRDRLPRARPMTSPEPSASRPERGRPLRCMPWEPAHAGKPRLGARLQLGCWIATGLLIASVAGGCWRFGPELSIGVDNTGGPRPVTVTVDSSASRRPNGPIDLAPGSGVAWSEPLGSRWEIRIDGKPVIGSADRPDLALGAPGRAGDVRVEIRIDGDGTVTIVDAR
jgi:hypothetical protein